MKQCRQAKISYTGKFEAEVCFEYHGRAVIREKYNFGQFPIMLRVGFVFISFYALLKVGTSTLYLSFFALPGLFVIFAIYLLLLWFLCIGEDHVTWRAVIYCLSWSICLVRNYRGYGAGENLYPGFTW